MNKKNISIKEIAKLSGVSVATVSRVINNNGRFSEETRKRILKIIEENNYSTNVIAKSLRMKKSNTIGIMVPDISNFFFSSTVQEIERIMFEQGYSTIICNTARNIDKETAYLRMLESKMIDGLIVISGLREFGIENMSKQIPLICIDRKPKDNDNTAFIESDHLEGAKLATTELINAGATKIIIMMHALTSSSQEARLNGFVSVFKQHHIPISDHNIVKIPKMNKEEEVIYIKNFLQNNCVLSKSINGIFAINDSIGVTILKDAKTLGINVPHNLKVIGFDDIPEASIITPGLSTIKQDYREIAKRACEILLNNIKSPGTITPIKQEIPVTLIKRGSTGT
ncbi:LacI family DNA-binding transcriptional regulator [Sporolactobacillus putidus]|uniref:LacI family transcriptional regulator n=1 Tax=Sporolactobacillus putidus TaxID=492735 RepID=A0A917W2Z6_9BACL|nr:LacI family DNA-binding transcriptional regulator [Sporolactobacillus putidus]GGL57580.1 LacI family transcriptional regulator [Sporolactobacillus putidus]